MNEKELMEALPIVAELSRKYTSGESSSVTYAIANQLMGAIVYCVNEYDTDNSLPRRQVELSLRERYELGRTRLTRKIQDCQSRYNNLTTYFKGYGNHNYEDTVIKAISGFFVHYDFTFCPQNTMITCDYPTIVPVCESQETGIDLIDTYLTFIELEQKFLQKLPDDYIYELLYRYDSDYKNQYYNISAVIFRSFLGCMLIGKNVMENKNQAYEQLFSIVQKTNLENLKQSFNQASILLFRDRYDEPKALHEYFKNEVIELAVRLKEVHEANYLQHILVL